MRPIRDPDGVDGVFAMLGVLGAAGGVLWLCGAHGLGQGLMTVAVLFAFVVFIATNT